MKTIISDIESQRQHFEACLDLFTSDLTYHQKGFESLLSEFKLNRSSEVHNDSLIVKSGTTMVISTTLDLATAFQPCIRRTDKLDQFKAWIGMPSSLFEQGVFSWTEDLPSKNWNPKNVKDISNLTQAEQEYLKRASYAYLFGNSNLVESYKEVIEKLYSPFEVAVCAIKKVVIESGGSLIIQGNRPAVFIVDELEIVEGANLKIYAPTNMTVDKLYKISNQLTS